MRESRITRCEKKPNGYERDGEPGGNGGGSENGGSAGNGGEGGDNHGGGGSKIRSGGGVKRNKTFKDFKSGEKTARPDCYFCIGSHKASECPNIQAGLVIVTSARLVFAANGAPRERHED